MVDSSSASRSKFSWATSKTIGGVSEIAVLAPIRTGCFPGEQRTYEERLRRRQSRISPTAINKDFPLNSAQIPVHSLWPHDHYSARTVPAVLGSQRGQLSYQDTTGTAAGLAYREPINDYIDLIGQRRPGSRKKEPAKYASFLLTLVEFDGDVKVYMRDIAEFLARDFDRIFENCEGYPTTRDFEVFWLWIRRYQINTNLFYAPYSNLSTVRIKQLEEFKRQFDAFVAQVYSPNGQRIKPVDELFEQFVRDNQRFARDFPTPSGIFRTDNS